MYKHSKYPNPIMEEYRRKKEQREKELSENDKKRFSSIIQKNINSQKSSSDDSSDTEIIISSPTRNLPQYPQDEQSSQYEQNIQSREPPQYQQNPQSFQPISIPQIISSSKTPLDFNTPVSDSITTTDGTFHKIEKFLIKN
mmetsp:Transcript_16968/g.14897  ORF Transcript_16968/g.14897 Transcript_16968/m.14897 type:complete len:141 (+) Transcript_16968:69-491(+)